ncbi:methyl-accepting chemotaxis protein [uncultured Treponema sp.]|uniref:methyl-accepting chemotaxis protein n=1 Tax=uncultured Treponema sp. TaxID=162155 RepID=UPI002597681A|nr:methyl-accepting chemotaxis protein [uncultured Treponema sp.]
MSKMKKEKHLLTRILLIVAATILIINTFQVIFIAERTKKITNQQIESDYTDLTKSYASQVVFKLSEYKTALDFYVNSDAAQTGDTEEIADWLRTTTSKRNKIFDYVAWVDETGKFQADNGNETFVTQRDYYQAIVKNGADEFIDNPATSLITGKTIIHVCRAVKHGGKNIGFFTGIVSMETINKLVKDITVGETGIATLFSGNGKVISTSGDLGKMETLAADKANNDVKNHIQTNSTSEYAEHFWNRDSHGHKQFNIFSGISGTQWSLVIIIEGAQIFRIANEIILYMGIAATILAVTLILVLSLCVVSIMKPLGVVEKTLQSISSGNADLSKRISVKTNADNEIGRLASGFNTFVEKLQHIIIAMKQTKTELVAAGTKLNDSTEDTAASITQIIANIESMTGNIGTQSESVAQTASAVNQIASNIESLNKMIENQSASVTEASAAVEEMIGNINSVNNSVTKMAEEFNQLEQKAADGVQKQDDVNARIQVIETESQALQEANTVISNIAEQTNLLAMNAAIEAAHAGEAGKGFSVVADEIRKLSETSSSQSKTIGEQLKKITDSIQKMVTASQEAGISFSSVSSGINMTNNLVQEIKNAMQEQGEGSKQISIALNCMNDSTSEVRTASSEMSEGNKTILEEIKVLQNATLSMKEGMEEMNIGAKKINETGSNLSSISENMKSSITKIGDEVDQFQV